MGVGYTVRRESEFGRMQEGLRIRRETNERTMPLRGEKKRKRSKNNLPIKERLK